MDVSGTTLPRRNMTRTLSQLGIVHGLVDVEDPRWFMQPKDPCPEEWSATFELSSLGLTGMVLGSPLLCKVSIPPKGGFGGSKPKSIDLPIIHYQELGDKRICVYAGWPTNDGQPGGKPTGMTIGSSDPPGTRVHEEKLGPTILWAVCCCEDVCISAVILKFVIKISSGGEEYFIENTSTPTPDGWTKGKRGHCLKPELIPAPQEGKSPFKGAVDQPGLTVTKEGSGLKDTEGKARKIRKGDKADVEFKQRAMIICDGTAIAMTEWGFSLSATLGESASEIQLQNVKDSRIKSELLMKGDVDPEKKKRFDKALGDYNKAKDKHEGQK